jgi:hypothetical protein
METVVMDARHAGKHHSCDPAANQQSGTHLTRGGPHASMASFASSQNISKGSGGAIEDLSYEDGQ